ncbi:hypothetical protein WM11_11875 [Burkholderia ubonensis]|nr:hypothetical protein WM11_11875 [Burkholderia ubonensis]KWK56576.1 hypothetical protein WM14_27370 [Burkholderia ubonensis]
MLRVFYIRKILQLVVFLNLDPEIAATRVTVDQLHTWNSSDNRVNFTNREPRVVLASHDLEPLTIDAIPREHLSMRHPYPKSKIFLAGQPVDIQQALIYVETVVTTYKPKAINRSLRCSFPQPRAFCRLAGNIESPYCDHCHIFSCFPWLTACVVVAS